MNTPLPVDVTHAREPSDRAIGWLLVVATALAALTMAHHPVINADAMADVVAEMTRKATVDRWVHGVMIALLGILLFAFSEYSRRHGRGTPLLRAALLAYAIGALASIGAGLVSGFITPELVLRYAGADPAALEALRHSMRLLWRFNQALAQLGEVARGLAIVLWSLALLRQSSVRSFALFGVVAGAAPVIAILAGWLPMHLTGAWLAMAPGVLWNFALAALLIRVRLH